MISFNLENLSYLYLEIYSPVYPKNTAVNITSMMWYSIAAPVGTGGVTCREGGDGFYQYDLL